LPALSPLPTFRYQIPHLGARPTQRLILRDPHRHKVVVAGARFGKTILGLLWLILCAMKFPRSKNWYICPTRIMAKDIAWDDLKNLLGISTGEEVSDDPDRPSMVLNVNEGDLKITLTNGSTIQLMTAQEPDRLRGRGLKSVVFDEFADMDPAVWIAVRPRLGDRRLMIQYGELGRTLFIGTPKGYNHFKDLFDEVRMGTRGSDWKAWRYTSVEGGNIDAAEIERAKHDLPLREWRQEYEASFESIEGRIYHAFMRDYYERSGQLNMGNIDESVHDPGGPILVGMDFNVNPMSATLSTKVRVGRPFLGFSAGRLIEHYECHTWGEVQLANCNTATMMKEIRERFPQRHLIVFPDPSGAARHTTSGNVGETDHSIIQSFGADLFVPKFKTNSDKYNCVNGMLCNTFGIRRKLINPHTCPNLVKGYDGLVYAEGSNLADKSSGLDHITDADAYMTLGAFPIVTATVTSTTVAM
jgi:Terminase large subunit, T4likevirus-type, N-terminal